MTAEGGPHPEARPAPPSLDALRRRVYSPHATAEDRERYLAAVEAHPRGAEVRVAPAPLPGGGAPDPERAGFGHRPRRLLATGAGAAVLAGAVLAAVLVAVHPSAIAGPPSRAATPVDVDAATRAAFIESLIERRAAGLAGYLVTYQFARRSALVIERWGTGPGAVSLQPGASTAKRRYATVYLVLDRDERAHWTAYAARPTTDSEDPLVAVAERTGLQKGGVPAYATFSYAADRPPLRLRIDVPKAVRWGAAVILTG